MAELTPVKIPLLNPNEPEALLVSLEKAEGDPVEAGDVIALIETTKSTGEIQVDKKGYLVGLRFNEGDSLCAGDVIAYIGYAPDASDPALPPWGESTSRETVSAKGLTGLRITDPARKLAQEAGLDLDSLPQDTLVTRQTIQAMLMTQKNAELEPVPAGENRLVIYGAGGHGRSLAALVQKLGAYEILGFLDDGIPEGEKVFGYKVLGGREKLAELADAGVQMAVNGIGGISDLESRLSVYRLLNEMGFHTPTMIHPTAFIEDSADFADGAQVFPLAYVGTQVKVGYGCIINTGAIVSHDCILSPYANLSPGATLAGGVSVGESTLIGMRVTINLYVKVGKRARIGNGATVKADVPDGGVVPAGTIWPPRQ